MVLDKNYKQLSGWSSLPPDLLWDIQNCSEMDAPEDTMQPTNKEQNQQGKEIDTKAHEEDILKVLKVFSQNNPADAATMDTKKKPKGWLRRSLSVISKVLRDSDQTQHVVLQNQVIEKENVQQKTSGCMDGEAKAGGEKEEHGHIEGTPTEESLDTSEGENSPTATQPTQVTEPLSLNITPFAEPGDEAHKIDKNEKDGDDGDNLKAKVENLASFVNETERADLGNETCTRASQALQNSSMKDRKVTEAVAAAVIIGAGILHVLAGGMSPDIPDSDIIALA